MFNITNILRKMLSIPTIFTPNNYLVTKGPPLCHCGLQELFKIILSALHVAPMDGMGRAVVVTGEAVGTAAVVLPTWRLALDVINGT